MCTWMHTPMQWSRLRSGHIGARPCALSTCTCTRARCWTACPTRKHPFSPRDGVSPCGNNHTNSNATIIIIIVNHNIIIIIIVIIIGYYPARTLHFGSAPWSPHNRWAARKRAGGSQQKKTCPSRILSYLNNNLCISVHVYINTLFCIRCIC